MKQSNTKEIAVITLKLLVICSVVATIVAFVNGITKDRIAYNEKVSTAEALSGIYSADYDGKVFTVDGDDYVIKNGDELVVKCSSSGLEGFISEDIKALYVLSADDGSSLGYCISIEPMGFKGAIKLLVAINSDQTVKGVKVVSMSETSGIGTKAVDEEWFLDQFVGHGSEIAESSEIKIISGATKTSKPIVNAVSTSVNQVNTYVSSTGGESK